MKTLTVILLFAMFVITANCGTTKDSTKTKIASTDSITTKDALFEMYKNQYAQMDKEIERRQKEIDEIKIVKYRIEGAANLLMGIKDSTIKVTKQLLQSQ